MNYIKKFSALQEIHLFAFKRKVDTPTLSALPAQYGKTDHLWF